MNVLPIITWLFVASCSAAPSSDIHFISKDLFLNKPVLYTGKHDIVNIFVPLNELDTKGVESSSKETNKNYIIFFVEADIDQKSDQGLYVYKNGQATKLLDHGRDAVTTHENINFFGAKDGIYKYNAEENKAEKFGTINDNIIQLAHNNKTDDIYYLNENHEFFKLSKDATSSVKVAHVKDAQKVVFGFEGNLYYFDSDKNVYVFDTQEDGGVPKKVTGLPSSFHDLLLLSPPIGLESGAILAVDGSIYILKQDATVYKTPVQFTFVLTAVAPQATVRQFYAVDKKIYEFDELVKLVSILGQ